MAPERINPAISSKIWGVNLNGLGFILVALDNIMVEPEEVVWVVGSDVEYAIWLEFGTQYAPPYPFLFPAANHVINERGSEIVEDSDDIEDMMRQLAEEVERQAKINLDASKGGRSPGTDPNHPQIQSGELYESIEAERIK